jgi:hypothetical protein
VTDGTHTASIQLEGDYLNAAFTASSDSQGGTLVTTHGKGTNQPHALISAIASFGASPVYANHLDEAWLTRGPLLAGPRVALA